MLAYLSNVGLAVGRKPFDAAAERSGAGTDFFSNLVLARSGKRLHVVSQQSARRGAVSFFQGIDDRRENLIKPMKKTFGFQTTDVG